MTDSTNRSNGIEKDLVYSKELYKETSKRLDKAYIILITFILFFFFALYLPYTFLEQKIESSYDDEIVANLSQLNKLTLAQANISRSIQNEIDTLVISATDDYKRLDEYYRKLELIQSKAFLASSNLSANELENISPTFFVCNQKFNSNVTYWVFCNAKFVANHINNKTVDRYLELGPKVIPLVIKAENNLREVERIANSLRELNRTVSQPPTGIASSQWKVILENVLKVKAQANTLKLKSEHTRDFLMTSNESALWIMLTIPPGSEIAVNENNLRLLDEAIRSLNQTRNQLIQEFKDLSSKFEEMEFPIIGRIPIGLANAVVGYPSAIGIGSLICSYYLGQTISKRLVFHEIFIKLHPNSYFNRNLYPVWVDPLDPGLFQYGRLVLFVSLPLVILFLITDLSLIGSTNPADIIGFTFLGISEDTVLTVGVFTGIVFISLGIFIIINKSHGYRSSLKTRNC